MKVTKSCHSVKFIGMWALHAFCMQMCPCLNQARLETTVCHWTMSCLSDDLTSFIFFLLYHTEINWSCHALVYYQHLPYCICEEVWPKNDMNKICERFAYWNLKLMVFPLKWFSSGPFPLGCKSSKSRIQK